MYALSECFIVFYSCTVNTLLCMCAVHERCQYTNKKIHMHGFRCYDNIAPNAKCQRVVVLALCPVRLCIYSVQPNCSATPAALQACGRGQTDRQTDTHAQTRVTTIHFASSTTRAKCNDHVCSTALNVVQPKRFGVGDSVNKLSDDL